MAKLNYIKNYDPRDYRQRIYNTYFSKYLNLFMNNFKWQGIEDDDAIYYMMREFFLAGSIWCGKIKNTELPYFTPYAVCQWNIYNLPVRLSITPIRWAPFLPRKILKVNEDGVIGYILSNHSSVLSNIETKIQRIVESEMLINNQIQLHKVAFLILSSPEDSVHMEDIITRILNDELVINATAEDYANIKVNNTSIPFIIDKIREYIKDVDNEILTILGINNVPHEKKEHLITSEIDSNNELIAMYKSNYIVQLKAFCDKIKDVLGINISVELNVVETPENKEEE